jgi:predicted dehydrogenase
MLEQVRPDIVTIATESGKHPEMAIECLEAGCNVICEKPMALATKDADAMIAAANRTGKTLGVCFQNRFNRPVQQLRAALEAGRLGRILHGMVQVRWRRGPEYYAGDAWRGTWSLDGGALMNQCIHGIDLLQWMLGEDAARVQAQTRRFLRPIEAEDFGAAIVEFRSGAVGIIEGTVDVYGGDLGVTLSVFGEKGTVVIGGDSASKMETWRIEGEADIAADAGDDGGSNGVYGPGHRSLFRNFAEALASGGRPLVSGEDGKKALELILAIYQSQKSGGPADLPCDFSTMEMVNEDFT